MHTEVDVPNQGGQIVAGMFADVILTLVKKNSTLTVPIQALTRNGSEASVLVVDPRGRVEERKVKLGLEGANDVEVVSGLSLKEQVVIGSRSQFHAGDVVAPQVIGESQKDKF
jgi:multidrug efflux pump subunit AcrA (membrane-fusion protein)